MALAVEDVAEIHERARQKGIAEIAQYLTAVLGRELTAYLADVSDPSSVSQWIRGTTKPTQLRRARLREGYEAVALLSEAYDEETAESWFLGSNPRLDDRAPLQVLHEVKSLKDIVTVGLIVPAARAAARLS